MAIGVNRNQQNTTVINNYYGGQQGMGGMGGSCMGGPMGMGQMGGPPQMMQMMMQMMMMMMQIMQMMMGGGCQQCMPGQFPGMMPGMGGGMPGMGGGMPGCGGFSPQMGNCLGNFMGMPGGGSGAYASAGPGGASAGAYGPGGGAYAGAGPGGAGAAAGGGPISGSGSGVDAVNMARRFLGRNSRDIKGELPHFTAAGGNTNNCADFVSSCLESQGLLKGHHVGVSNGNLERALIQQGYKRIPPNQARPGDVWISNSRGHTELVQGVQGNKLSTIGSNNVRQGFQKITERQKSFNSGVVYGRR